MNLLEAMRIRKSDRTYLTKAVPENLLNRLIDIYDTSDRLNTLNLRLLKMESALVEHAMTGLIGNYGHIKNAPIWVIGISENGKNYQENFGFAMEQFILECTREGLGTCWVGGFFKTSLLERAVPKNENERIVLSVLTSLKKKYPKIVEKGKGMNFDFQGVDAGIGMAHISIAAKEFDINGEWSLEFNDSAIRAAYQIPGEAKIIGVFDIKTK